MSSARAPYPDEVIGEMLLFHQPAAPMRPCCIHGSTLLLFQRFSTPLSDVFHASILSDVFQEGRFDKGFLINTSMKIQSEKVARSKNISFPRISVSASCFTVNHLLSLFIR